MIVDDKLVLTVDNATMGIYNENYCCLQCSTRPCPSNASLK